VIEPDEMARLRARFFFFVGAVESGPRAKARDVRVTAAIGGGTKVVLDSASTHVPKCGPGVPNPTFAET
jgi:hypothetical protein